MIKQLKDYINIADILANNNLCITSLFSTLDSTYNVYLKQILNTNKDSLSIEYLSNRLDKLLAPTYNRLIDYYVSGGDDNDTALQKANAKLIKVIENKFLYNWNKLADSLFADYNPINNYDMEEHRNINTNSNIESYSSGSNESTEDVNTSSTENSSNSVNNNGEIETNDKEVQKYAGFNSDSPKTVTEADKEGGQSETRIGNSEESKSTSGTESRSGTSSSVNTSETSGTSAANKQEEILTRSGNIGVTTSQQMIQSEIELRKHNLIDIIFGDMDSILFLDYYL